MVEMRRRQVSDGPVEKCIIYGESRANATPMRRLEGIVLKHWTLDNCYYPSIHFLEFKPFSRTNTFN